jgi:hypothetical protein
MDFMGNGPFDSWQNGNLDSVSDWIPDLNLAGAVLSGYNRARYYRVGKLIYIDFEADNQSLSGSAGAIGISLPFAAKSTKNNFLDIDAYDTGTASYRKVMNVSNAGSTAFAIYKTANFVNWAASEIGVYICIKGCYEAA